MENKIEIDFSIIEETTISKPKKTIRAVYITGAVLIVAAIIIYINMHIWKLIVMLFLILALSLVVLCYILHKLEYIQLTHEIEEKKANAALRRKLAEDAIIREIKIREKKISDAQKNECQNDKGSLYKDVEKTVRELKFLCSLKTEDERIKEMKKLINDLERILQN